MSLLGFYSAVSSVQKIQPIVMPHTRHLGPLLWAVYSEALQRLFLAGAI